MKIPSLVSDRSLFSLLIQYGLCGIMGNRFIPLYEGTSIVILFLVVIPVTIASLISKSKVYKKLIFSDERYPERKESNMNVLISFLMPAGYVIFMIIYYCVIENIIQNFNKDIYFFLIDVIYFVSVFLLFLKRITFEKD